MKIKELKELIATLDDDMLVITSGDSEGNYFRELDGYSFGQYSTSTQTYSDAEDSDEDGTDDESDYPGDDDYSDDDDTSRDTEVPCFCLWV